MLKRQEECVYDKKAQVKSPATHDTDIKPHMIEL